jgi:hypothetical protein
MLRYAPEQVYFVLHEHEEKLLVELLLLLGVLNEHELDGDLVPALVLA